MTADSLSRADVGSSNVCIVLFQDHQADVFLSWQKDKPGGTPRFLRLRAGPELCGLSRVTLGPLGPGPSLLPGSLCCLRPYLPEGRFGAATGGEYQKMHNSFFRSLGILHRVSCPHTHQQNGSAERKHCHIVETGLALLAHASVPLKFWDDAFLCATYLIN